MQARVAAEARKVLEAKRGGEETRAMTYDDLYEMPLLTKCKSNECTREDACVCVLSRTCSLCAPPPTDTTLTSSFPARVLAGAAAAVAGRSHSL